MKANGPTQAIIDSAINPKWQNRGTKWVEIEVPPGIIVNRGPAAKQNGLVGGGEQVYIEGDIPFSWVKGHGSF